MKAADIRINRLKKIAFESGKELGTASREMSVDRKAGQKWRSGDGDAQMRRERKDRSWLSKGKCYRMNETMCKRLGDMEWFDGGGMNEWRSLT